MEKNSLLAEIEKEQKEIIEQKFIEHKQEHTIKQLQKQDKTINIFSANAFPKEKLEEDNDIIQEKEKQDYDNFNIEQEPESKDSLVVETPNYDFIETLTDEQRKKIFKIEREDQDDSSSVKPKKSKFKMIILSILFAIFGVWGIVNITTLDSLNGQISEITTEYNMNLITYLNNLHNLDATNAENMENLFETIPVENQRPNVIDEQSNWFDRFCNFIAGLFGG